MDIKIKPKIPNTIKPIKTILKTKSELIDIETFIDLYFKIKISPETFEKIVNTKINK